MLEVMGIRVGVEDEDGDSDAEDDIKLDAYDAWSGPAKSKWKRRSQRPGQEDYSVSPPPRPSFQCLTNIPTHIFRTCGTLICPWQLQPTLVFSIPRRT